MSSTASPTPSPTRWPRVVTTVVAAVLTLGMVTGAVLSWWTHHTLLDTPRFVEVVRPVATSPATTERIVDEATTRVTTVLDLEERITQALTDLADVVPEGVGDLDDLLGGGLGTLLGDGLGELLGTGSLGDLLDPDAAAEVAPQVAEDLEARVVTAVETAIDTPAFQAELLRAVEQSHRDLVDLVRADDDGVGGDLVVDLEPLLLAAAGQAADDLEGLPGQLARQAVTTLDVPDDQSRLVLVRAAQLRPYRPSLSLLDRGTWAFVAAAAVLALATMAVSRRWWGVVLAGSAAAAGATLAPVVAQGRIDTELLVRVDDPAGRATAVDLADALLEPLGDLVGTVQVGGLALAALGLLGLVVVLVVRRPAASSRA